MAVSIRRLPLWVWWIAVVWLVSLPVGLTLQPQWQRVHTIPFTDPADKFADLALNLLLFLPFGFSFMRWSRNAALVAVAAAATSISAELLQLFSTVRYPSGTDVTCAVVGALVGGLAAVATSRGRP